MLGQRIKDYLIKKGIKQSFLVAETGLTADAISNICNGTRKIDAVEYYNICKALGVPLETFFEDDEESED